MVRQKESQTLLLMLDHLNGGLANEQAIRLPFQEGVNRYTYQFKAAEKLREVFAMTDFAKQNKPLNWLMEKHKIKIRARKVLGVPQSKVIAYGIGK